MAKKGKWLYTAVLPGGKEVTRGSNRDYSHYWSCSDGGERGASGFAGSEALARSSIVTTRNQLYKGIGREIPTTEVIVPVTRVER